MEVLYLDNKIIVCVKPAGVLSTDEPGGMPSLLRAALGDDTAPVYTVHRLDAAVSGVMVYARTRHAAADLGRAFILGRLIVCDGKNYFAPIAYAEATGVKTYDGTAAKSWTASKE